LACSSSFFALKRFNWGRNLKISSFARFVAYRQCRLALFGLTLAAPLLAGCSSEPPPPDPATMEEGIKQLNEHRDREWNNQ
jgi:hypothetical protein